MLGSRGYRHIKFGSVGSGGHRPRPDILGGKQMNIQPTMLAATPQARPQPRAIAEDTQALFDTTDSLIVSAQAQLKQSPDAADALKAVAKETINNFKASVI